MIPIKYNIRNLRVRWVTTLMTVVGTGLVVWATVLSFGLSDGLDHALRISGDDLDLIVLRKGSTDETSSNIDQKLAREVANLDGIARDNSGEPMCSAEFVTILTKPRRHDGGTTNLIVRGLQEGGRGLRPNFRIVRGRDVRPGLNEAITSERMAERFENLALGEKLEINKVNFEIVGYFEAAGSAAESEVWTDLRDVTSARRTPGALSSVNLRVRDEQSKLALLNRIRDDEQFKLDAVDEMQYFEKQMTASIAIQFVGFAIAGFLTLGAMFAAANTMYAAVASRGREIGALRAIGFSRRSVLSSFLFESVVLCLLGGVLGCLATLPFNGLSTGTANWATFSEITFAFRFGPIVLLRGVAMALTMGVLGGLFPALRAVRMPITSALRET
ncbi:MAG TPA: ABC transporter permease [Planctomycetaceae bacterium]|nr:ABC transporter permease [Planctomycetaceae bacterium]